MIYDITKTCAESETVATVASLL